MNSLYSCRDDFPGLHIDGADFSWSDFCHHPLERDSHCRAGGATRIDGAGRQAIFEELRLFLMGEKVSLTYTLVAERLGTSEGAVKMMVQRMRRRYRECLQLVVGRTVRDPEQVDEELRHLVQALK